MSDLIKEFKAIDNDVAKWKWVLEHQKNGVKVMCDNDDTFIVIEDGEEWASFDFYIGWSDGIFQLLEAIGINAESV